MSALEQLGLKVQSLLLCLRRAAFGLLRSGGMQASVYWHCNTT